MVYTRKTRLFNLPGADIATLTNHLDVASETRGWRRMVEHLGLSIGEVKRCESCGGAAPVVDLICQRGWTVGKVLDVLEKIGNQAASSSLLEIVSDSTSNQSAKLYIEGESKLDSGDEMRLCVVCPRKFTDIQWYFDTTCLVAEKSHELVINQVAIGNAGRYKVRLESSSGDVRWIFADVVISHESEPTVEDLVFLLHPQDYHLKESCTDAHFFVDVRPYNAQLQWYCEGILMHGKTQEYLCVSGLDQSAHRRQYKCSATAGSQTILSEPALVRWTPEQAKELGASTFAETATDKVALIIGNQKYSESSFGDIVHAENDARDISRALRVMNFKVVSLINLTGEEMLAACDNFYKLLSSGVYGVFYFAGHGFENAGHNYLVPVDAPASVRVEHCIKAQHVLHRMQFRDTKLNLLLLDMCREFANMGGIPGDIQPVRSRGNTAIGFACGPGSRAYGSENDKNGIYVKYLKDQISRNITVTNLLDSVNRAIGANEPSGYQRPHYRSSIIKNISLNDPIDTTDHTAEFHHRSIIWNMANNVDKEVEELTLRKSTISLHYSAIFSNVLQVELTPTPDSLHIDQESLLCGLILATISPGVYQIRNVQRLTGPLIELTVAIACETGTVRIERPLFAKITANRLTFGNAMEMHLAGGQERAKVSQQLPAYNRARGYQAEENCTSTSVEPDNDLEYKAKQKLKEIEKFDTDKDCTPEKEDLERSLGKLPAPLRNHDNRLVYPFVGIYLFPLSSSQDGEWFEREVMKVAEDSLRSAHLEKVKLTVTQLSSPWIEVLLEDSQYKSSRDILEGKSWKGTTASFSLHTGSLLNMLLEIATNHDISEMWVTDVSKFRQVLPAGDLLIDVCPHSLPVA